MESVEGEIEVSVIAGNSVSSRSCPVSLENWSKRVVRVVVFLCIGVPVTGVIVADPRTVTASERVELEAM